VVVGAALIAGATMLFGASPATPPVRQQAQSSGQADAIIRTATPAMLKQLLGPFEPSSPLEKDILAAALLDIEGRQLASASMAGDPAARARRREIADLIAAYDTQHASLREAGTPFGYQWGVLSGAVTQAPAENLIPPIRALYEARYGARDAAAREQSARMLAADQAVAGRIEPQAAARARAAESAAAACGAAADGTRFEPGDLDAALRWWIARTREVGAAQRTGNKLRIDAAQQAFRQQLDCLINQRITYTFRVQAHPIRDDPPISAAGVLVGIYHQTDDGVIRVGGERDARGIQHAESAPILLRAGSDIDAAVLPTLSRSSTFVVSARIAKTNVLGATALRAPTLILFVTDVKVEGIKP
jgi:hypothetical protein